MSTDERLPQSKYDPSSAAPATAPSPRDQIDIPQFIPPAGTHWPSTNFVLAAGTATFQPSTGKVVIIEDTARRRPNTPRESWCWLLPRGRKDHGEALEQCAVRETFEEVATTATRSLCARIVGIAHTIKAGYVATLLRSQAPTLQPKSAKREIGHSEAFHVQLIPYLGHRHRLPTHISDMAMYLLFWYLCTIPAGAVRAEHYGAHLVGARESGYNSELVDVAEAVRLLSNGRLEYRYCGKGPEGESRSKLVETKTGQKIHWGDLEAQDSGSLQAFIVAQGWESVKAADEDGENQWRTVE